MITLHHLGISQSERIVWLLEELGLEYHLVKHERAPLLSPDSLKSLPENETGRSPFIQDSDANITLGESGAICEYLIQRYGGGRFAIASTEAEFPDYLYWFHYGNASLQANMVCSMFIGLSGLPADSRAKASTDKRLHDTFKHLDDRLKNNKWLAGSQFTAADIICVYPATTQRYFGPQTNLHEFPHLLRWLKDCAARPAYQRAMEKGDPEMKLLLGAEAPEVGLLVSGGVNSPHWKKASA